MPLIQQSAPVAYLPFRVPNMGTIRSFLARSLSNSENREGIDRVMQCLRSIADILPFAPGTAPFRLIRYASAAVSLCNAAVSAYYTYMSVFGVNKANETQRTIDNFFHVYDSNGISFDTKDSFVSPRLFRENIRKVMDIVSIKKCTGMLSVVDADYTDFVEDGDLVDFLVMGHSKQDEMPVVIHTTYKHSEVFKFPDSSYDHPFTSRSDAESFLKGVTQAILEELSSGVVEVVKTKKGDRYDSYDTVGFRLVEFDPPKFFDEDLVNKIVPAAEAALTRGIKTGILLYGDYGVSKTTTVNKILSMFDVLKIRITNAAYQDAKAILEGLKTKKIVVIDDADIGANGDKTEDVSELLNFLDSNAYDLVFIVVNDTSALCPAITRPGRCDIKIHCPRPNPETIETILRNLMRANDDPRTTDRYSDLVSRLHAYDATHALVKACYMNSIRYNISLEEATSRTLQMEDSASAASETNEEDQDASAYHAALKA